MGGSSQPQMMPTFSAQNQQTNKDPWAAAIPALSTTLQGAEDAYKNTYNGPNVASMDPNVTAGQNTILGNANSGVATGAANSAFGGLQSILGNLGLSGQQTAGAGAISGAMGNLSPMASGAMLDPSKDPNFAKSLQDSLDQTANTVNAQFAGAGRYGSGAQADTLARSLGSVASNAYSNRYAQNEQNMLNTNNQTGSLASMLAGIGQSGVGNIQNAGSAISGLDEARGLDATNQMGVGAQRMSYDQQLIDSANQAPWTKVGNLAQIASGVGSLGGTSQTNSQGVSYAPQQNTQPSGLQSILGGGIGGIGALGNLASGLGKMGVTGSGIASTLASFLPFSDERLKDQIERIGRTDDGQAIYSYSFKSDPLKRTQIGLLAQEVEKTNPDAVVADDSGLKHVDYARALRKAA